MLKSSVYGGTGSWYHLQIANPNRFRTPTGGASTPGQGNGKMGLDEVTPYGAKFAADGSAPSNPDYDGPGTALGDSGTHSYQEYNIQNETYTMYIMYTPPGGVEVPISFFTWSWNVDITVPLPSKLWSSWGTTPTKGTITPKPAGAITSFPEWTMKADPGW